MLLDKIILKEEPNWYFKVIGMLQHNYAFIHDKPDGSAVVYFLHEWEEFNEFLSKRNLKNASYQTDQYIITNITNDEVLGIAPFFSRGNIKINRNSLMVYVEEYFEGKFSEMSYIYLQ